VVRIDRATVLRVLAILIAGGALRLATPHDYEYKADEAAMVALVQEARTTGALPWLGMPTSQGVRNPGMSVWPFVALSYVFGADGYGLTQGVRWLNVLALAAAVAFALSRMGGSDQPLWLAGLLLAAVNPLEIVLQRKLWAQSVLPIIALLVLWLWVDRKRSWRHAAGLGAGAAVLAQIHPSGMFVVAALLGGALWDRQRREVRWVAAVLGFAAVAWPLYFWVEHLVQAISEASGDPASPLSLRRWAENVVSFRYVHLLISNLSGVMMRHSLGDHFWEFVRQPVVLVAHVALVVIALVTLGRWLMNWRMTVAGETAPLLLWGLVGTGVLMTVAGVFVQRHYYLGLFPLPYVAFALLLLRNARSWTPVYAVAVLQLVISAAFLLFIHENGGAPGAEFGALPR
jgi:4-amino-4-deoxy-L-arabinose transferase-like glycosyltransferase